MKVSVIIPTTERTLPYLELTVKSLRATVDWDIIVVSNGTESPYPIPKTWGISQRLHTKDRGQCLAVNIGAQVANRTSNYLMVTNDDMYYAPNWNKHLEFDYPVFSPNLIEPVEIGSAPPFLKFDGGQELSTFKEEAVDKFIANHEFEGETTGFNLPFFIKPGIWRTIEGYDIRYDPWGSNSDTDLQTKLELAGIQPIRLRDVLVYHFGSKSGTFEGDKQAFWQKNWDYYTSKWGFNRDMEPIPDTWMATNMINKELNRFHPKWEGKYGG